MKFIINQSILKLYGSQLLLLLVPIVELYGLQQTSVAFVGLLGIALPFYTTAVFFGTTAAHYEISLTASTESDEYFFIACKGAILTFFAILIQLPIIIWFAINYLPEMPSYNYYSIALFLIGGIAETIRNTIYLGDKIIGTENRSLGISVTTIAACLIINFLILNFNSGDSAALLILSLSPATYFLGLILIINIKHDKWSLIKIIKTIFCLHYLGVIKNSIYGMGNIAIYQIWLLILFGALAKSNMSIMADFVFVFNLSFISLAWRPAFGTTLQSILIENKNHINRNIIISIFLSCLFFVFLTTLVIFTAAYYMATSNNIIIILFATTFINLVGVFNELPIFGLRVVGKLKIPTIFGGIVNMAAIISCFLIDKNSYQAFFIIMCAEEAVRAIFNSGYFILKTADDPSGHF